MDAEGAKTNLTDLIEDIMDFLLTNRAHPDSIRDIAEMALGTQMSRTPEEIKGIWSENDGSDNVHFAIRRTDFILPSCNFFISLGWKRRERVVGLKMCRMCTNKDLMYKLVLLIPMEKKIRFVLPGD